MNLKTSDGQEIAIGAGCVIGFCEESHTIVLLPESGSNVRIMWPRKGVDEKRIVPSCIRTSDDFAEVTWLIANVLGLQIVKDKFEYYFGPAYIFVE